DRMIIPIEDGRPVFRLKAFAVANGFPPFQEHQALADVKAALHICKMVRRAAPDLWSNFLRFSSKQSAIGFLKDEPALLLFEATSRRASFCVSLIGANRKPALANTYYVLDLSADLGTLQRCSELQLKEAIMARPEIVRKVKVNAAPLLYSNEEAPLGLLNGHAENELRDKGETVQGNKAFLADLLSV